MSEIQQPSKNEKRKFTTAALKDELTKQLSSKIEIVGNPETLDIDIRFKYHVLAGKLLYRINLARPVPVFEINLSDLSLELVAGLEELVVGDDDSALDDIAKDAISRMYESVNSDYFHTSGVRGKIRWRFVD